MERVLGIDGGGTKTEVVLADRAGQVMQRRRAEGTDPIGSREWEVTLADIAREAGPVRKAVLGLPYHGEIEDVSRRQVAVARATFGPRALVLNDVAVAFEGALGGGDGVLVLAGTGSMAWARGPLGTHRVGGWGDVFGDEGSAYWIGCKALQRVSQELDGRRTDRGFAKALLQRLQIGPGDLIGWTYGLTARRSGVASVAAHVSDLAQAGVPDALEVMTKAGQALAEHALAAARLSGAHARWSHAGGVMADPTVLAVLAAEVGMPATPPVLPPVGGAVLLAAQAAGWVTGPGFFGRLQQSLAETGGRP